MHDTLHHEPRFNETVGDVIAELKDEMRDLAQDIADTPTEDRGPLLVLLNIAGWRSCCVPYSYVLWRAE